MPAPRAALLIAALLAAGAALAAVLTAGGAIGTAEIPGLADPGPLTPLAVAACTVLADLAAALTVGLLLAAAFLVPGDPATGGRLLSPQAYRWVRAATWAALVWATANLARLLFFLSDVIGVPVDKLRPRVVAHFALDTGFGRVLLAMAAGAAAVAVTTRLVLSTSGAAMLAVAALVAALPAAFAGHAAGAGDHQLAVSAMLYHLAGALAWTGGLVALLLVRRLPAGGLPAAASRYSRLAGWGFTAVAAGGLLNAYARLGWRLDPLLGTGYGRILLVKSAALVVLGVIGFVHRRRTLPRLAAGVSGAFRRLAIAETMVLAATFGVAVGLSRTPSPEIKAEQTSAQALLGFRPPATPPNLQTLLTGWLPDPIWLGLAAAAIGLYAAGVRRITRRGDPWPIARTVAWCTGWTLAAAATCGGLARYGPILLSAHLAQHAVLSAVAPIALALAAPVTLARHAWRPAGAPGLRGPREWLDIVATSPIARLFTSPAVALVLWLSGLSLMYFTGLFQLTARSHAAHLLASVGFLAVGLMFFGPLVARPRPAGLALLGAALTISALFVWALAATSPLVGDPAARLSLPWTVDPIVDQRAGAVIWAVGQLPALALLAWWITALLPGRRRRNPCWTP